MADRDAPEKLVPFLFLPGTRGGLERIGPSLARILPFATPAWIEPNPREPLAEYAARLAKHVDPGVPCIVGGLSFGGMVALELATHLNARLCVLIASVRSPAEFPPLYRLAKPLAIFGPHAVQPIARFLTPSISSTIPAAAAVRLRALGRAEGAFYRWANWAALSWKPTSATLRVRSIQIHGDADGVFPIRHTRPDIVVPGAGHSIAMTHAELLASTIEEIYRREIAGWA